MLRPELWQTADGGATWANVSIRGGSELEAATDEAYALATARTPRTHVGRALDCSGRITAVAAGADATPLWLRAQFALSGPNLYVLGGNGDLSSCTPPIRGPSSANGSIPAPRSRGLGDGRPMRRPSSGPRARRHDGRGDAVDVLRCDWRGRHGDRTVPQLVDAGRGLVIGRPRLARTGDAQWGTGADDERRQYVRVVLSSPSTVSWVGSATHLRPTLSLPAVSSNRVTRASPGAPWRSRANPVRLRDDALSIDPVPKLGLQPHWPVPLAAAWMAKGARGPYLSVSVRHHRESTAPPVR